MRHRFTVLVFTILFCLSASAGAQEERWVLIGHFENNFTELDTSTLSILPDRRAVVWLSTYFGSGRTVPDDTIRYNRRTMKAEFDCKNDRMRMMAIRYENKGTVVLTGSFPSQQSWDDAAPETLAEHFVRSTCRYLLRKLVKDGP